MSLASWLSGNRPQTAWQARNAAERVYAILLRHGIDSIEASEIVVEIEAVREDRPDGDGFTDE